MKYSNSLISKMFRLIFFGKSYIIVTYLFIFISGFLFINELFLSFKYEDTIGYYGGYTNYMDDEYSYKYFYEVDGNTYIASPNLNTNHRKKNAKVYYNPDNPSESIIFSDIGNLYNDVVDILKINLNDKIKFMRFYYLKLIRPFIFIY